jgi:hypothetical protein
VNGHAQNLALAVLLYFQRHENTSASQTFRRWRQITDGQTFSATTLVELAQRVLDEQPLPDTPKMRIRKEDQKLHERFTR